MSQFIQTQKIAEKTQIAVQKACDADAKARVSSQLAREYVDKYMEICKRWEDITNLQLEHDLVKLHLLSELWYIRQFFLA